MSKIRTLLLIVNIILSIVLAYWMTELLVNSLYGPEMNCVDYPESFLRHAFIVTLTHSIIYFSFLLTFPFFVWRIYKKLKFKGLVKPILISELIIIVYIQLFSPPDLMSTIVLIVLWQFVFLVNGLVLHFSMVEEGK